MEAPPWYLQHTLWFLTGPFTPAPSRARSNNAYEDVRKIARRFLRSRVQNWRSLDPSEKDDYINQVVVEVYEQAGGAPDNITTEMVRVAANKVRAERRGWEEQTHAAGADIETVSFADLTPAALPKSDQLREDREAYRRLIQKYETDPLSRLVLSLHIGGGADESPMPGLPASLLGTRPLYHIRKEHPVPPGYRVRCPTCRLIARLIRHPTLGPDAVARLVDRFAARLSGT